MSYLPTYITLSRHLFYLPWNLIKHTYLHSFKRTFILTNRNNHLTSHTRYTSTFAQHAQGTSQPSQCDGPRWGNGKDCREKNQDEAEH